MNKWVLLIGLFSIYLVGFVCGYASRWVFPVHEKVSIDTTGKFTSVQVGGVEYKVRKGEVISETH